MRRVGLRHARDVQSVAFMVLVPVLVAWLWTHDWQSWLYVVLVVTWIGVGVIHHHHAHLPMWHSRRLNRATDLGLAVLQGHPTHAFVATHQANHHRFHHGPQDWARTYRFWGGDTNHLMGYLLHPLQAAWALYPHFWQHLRRMRSHRPGVWRWAMLQYALVFALWAVLLWLDWRKALVCVMVPQAIAMHSLLGANYFQHAHADGASRWNHARNFEGGVNWLYFNIGFHTAHHTHPRVHWSRMPALHAALRHQVDPRLIEPSLLRYVVRVMLLAPWVPALRSRSLMAARPHDNDVPHPSKVGPTA